MRGISTAVQVVIMYSKPLFIPNKIKDLYKKNNKDKFKLSVDITTSQCLDLMKNGFRNLHFYTLNQSDLTGKICSNLTKKKILNKDYDAFWT